MQNKSGCCGNHCWFVFVVRCGFFFSVFLLNPFAPQYQETTIKVGFGTLRRGGGGPPRSNV